MASVTVGGRDLALGVPTLLVALCPVGLGILAGPLGAVVGLAAALVWIASPVYAFAVAELGLLVALEAPVAVPRLAALQAIVFGLLLAETLATHEDDRTPLAFVAVAVPLAGGVVLAVDTGLDPVVIAGLLVATVAVAGYLTHRYAQVALGLVAGTEGVQG